MTLNDNDSEITDYDYDDANRLLTLSKESAVTSYYYDYGGRLIEMDYPNGAVASYNYDAANRLTTSITTKGASLDDVISTFTYTYDRVGNKMTMEDMRGTTTYEYDYIYRITKVTYPDGNWESYTYDNVGNRETKSGTIATASYGYNNSLNQLTSKTETRKAITVSGDVSDNSGIESVTVNSVSAIIDSDAFYAVNVAVEPDQPNTLTAEAIDTAGNKGTDEITVEHMGASTTTYSYDANGNLEEKTVDGDVTTYEYDYENRLVKVNLPGGITTNDFVYDGDKRRISRTNAVGETTKFLYDGLNILKDFDGLDQEIASYVQGVGIDSLISREEGGEVAYFHADALGSARVLTDANQNTVAQYDYDAWGKELIGTGSNSNEYTFTGRRKEEDLGLMYYRARFYDPTIGRFTTPDPLTGGPDDPTISYQNNIYAFVNRVITQFFSSMDPHNYRNRYTYCSNNPINFTDPLGLKRAMKEVGEEFEDRLAYENETNMEDMADKFAREYVDDQIDKSELTPEEKQQRREELAALSDREFQKEVKVNGITGKEGKNAPQLPKWGSKQSSTVKSVQKYAQAIPGYMDNAGQAVGKAGRYARKNIDYWDIFVYSNELAFEIRKWDSKGYSGRINIYVDKKTKRILDSTMGNQEIIPNSDSWAVFQHYIEKRAMPSTTPARNYRPGEMEIRNAVPN